MSHLASSMSLWDKGGEETAAKNCSARREEEEMKEGLSRKRQAEMYGASACDTVMTWAGGEEEQF